MILNMNKKITTIDELAVMINKSFVGVESRIAGVESRLVGVESRLEGIETRLVKVETRLDSVETRLDSVESRLTGVEGQLISFKTNVEGRFDDISRELKENRNYIKEADVRPTVVNLEIRVDKIERGMKFQG
jgi:archaellum component FlaC